MEDIVGFKQTGKKHRRTSQILDIKSYFKTTANKSSLSAVINK